MLKYIFVIMSILTIASCSDKSTSPKPMPTALQTQLAILTRQYGYPGAVGIVFNSDSTIDVRAAGVRKIGKSAAVTSDDLFHIGSLTKSMDAVMIGRIIESGQLSWNSRPADIIPGLSSVIDSGYANATILDLLHHRGGVPEDSEINADSLPHFSGTLTEQRIQAVLWMMSKPPTHQLGTYAYSNAGYVIAACMAECATNLSWRQLMDQQLFQPLGISAFYGWPTSYNPNEPWGHEAGNPNFIPIDPSVYQEWIKFLEPAGDISMNIEDLAKFMKLLMDAKRGQPRLLNSQTFDVLFTPVDDYACGLTVVQTGMGILITHAGSNSYFFALMYVLPDANISAAIMVNGYNEDLVLPVYQAIENVILSQQM